MILVTGCGRCGSSLVMQMLARAGYPCFGQYPSYEDTRSMASGSGFWNALPERIAVKLLDQHRFPDRLPKSRRVGVVLLSRDPVQQARSFAKFLNATFEGIRIGPDGVSKIAESMIREFPHLQAAACRNDRPMLAMTFEELVERPALAARRLADFVCSVEGESLDPALMASCVAPRTAECFPTLYELELVRTGEGVPMTTKKKAKRRAAAWCEEGERR